MTKYWNPRRIQRARERNIRAQKRAEERFVALREKSKMYSPGDSKKNAALMLDALGLPIRRGMVSRLRHGGAMSISKLAEPFHITLPSALEHVRILERSGIITTHKQGRVRLCVYSRVALGELAGFLASNALRFD